jgi:hypothetical protein
LSDSKLVLAIDAFEHAFDQGHPACASSQLHRIPLSLSLNVS